MQIKWSYGGCMLQVAGCFAGRKLWLPSCDVPTVLDAAGDAE